MGGECLEAVLSLPEEVLPVEPLLILSSDFEIDRRFIAVDVFEDKEFFIKVADGPWVLVDVGDDAFDHGLDVSLRLSLQISNEQIEYLCSVDFLIRLLLCG